MAHWTTQQAVKAEAYVMNSPALNSMMNDDETKCVDGGLGFLQLEEG
jgi:hypothetical protein